MVRNKKILSNLIIFILGIIAILVIWASIQLNVQNKEYIDIFGYSIFSTETGSMYPTINVGDIVIVKLDEPVQEQDIVTYKQEKSFITHRIIKKEGNSIIAKGDNNNTQDEMINENDVIGKVVYIINNVEVWKKVFTDIRVIIPVCITLVLFVLISILKEGEKDD